MSTNTLRRLACSANGDLASQAFIAAMNIVRTGLATEQEIAISLVQSSILASTDAGSAIERGFAAARKKAP